MKSPLLIALAVLSPSLCAAKIGVRLHPCEETAPWTAQNAPAAFSYIEKMYDAYHPRLPSGIDESPEALNPNCSQYQGEVQSACDITVDMGYLRKAHIANTGNAASPRWVYSLSLNGGAMETELSDAKAVKAMALVCAAYHDRMQLRKQALAEQKKRQVEDEQARLKREKERKDREAALATAGATAGSLGGSSGGSVPAVPTPAAKPAQAPRCSAAACKTLGKYNCNDISSVPALHQGECTDALSEQQANGCACN